MSKKLWIGGIYLKEEGGYEIILRSLNHYKKRLQTIHASPELKEAAAMFAPVLQSQARKRIPIIDETIEKINQYLLDSTSSQTLEENLETIQKALECRKSDIEKAEETGKEYFIKLVGNIQDSKKDTELIKNALIKIKNGLE
jgi:hemerythrin-like domain-containing protein